MPHLPFSQLLLLSTCHMGYPFGQFGSAVLAIFAPKVLPTPSLLVKGNVGEAASILCEHCSAGAETLVC